MDTGTKVRLMRVSRGLSQDQLASILGMSRSQISHYENGSRRLPNGRLETIEEILREDIEANKLKTFCGDCTKNEKTCLNNPLDCRQAEGADLYFDLYDSTTVKSTGRQLCIRT